MTRTGFLWGNLLAVTAVPGLHANPGKCEKSMTVTRKTSPGNGDLPRFPGAR